MASGGISGVAVALATAGGVLIYAGFQGKNPVEALKDITSGKTAALEPTSVNFVNDPTQLGQAGGGGGVIAASTGGGSATGAAIVAAAMNHRGERYSQARRWQSGYSDCSSFVGKALKDAGITPPSGSVTGSYRVWNKLKTVPRASIQAGDILSGSGHVAIAINATQAIGQQSSRTNVRIDTIDNIMFGQVGWVARRYMGKAKSTGAGVATA